MTNNFVSVQISSVDRRNICRSRHELQDSIQKFLNSFVFVSRSTANRNSCTLACTFSQCCFHCFYRRFFTFQIFHHQIIIQLADFLYQFCMIQFCFVLHIFRNIYYRDIITLIIVVDVSFHLEQVNDSLEFIFFTDWQLKTNCIFS